MNIFDEAKNIAELYEIYKESGQTKTFLAFMQEYLEKRDAKWKK